MQSGINLGRLGVKLIAPQLLHTYVTWVEVCQRNAIDYQNIFGNFCTTQNVRISAEVIPGCKNIRVNFMSRHLNDKVEW